MLTKVRLTNLGGRDQKDPRKESLANGDDFDSEELDMEHWNIIEEEIDGEIKRESIRDQREAQLASEVKERNSKNKGAQNTRERFATEIDLKKSFRPVNEASEEEDFEPEPNLEDLDMINSM